LIVFANLNDY